MRRTASEIIRNLEMRIARLERESSIQNHLAFVQAVELARKVKIRREGDINLALIIALQRGGAPQSDYIKLMEDIAMSWEELNRFYGSSIAKAVHDIVHSLKSKVKVQQARTIAMLTVNAILKSIPKGSVPKENAIKRLNRLNIGDGTAEYESFIGESESSNIRSAMRGHRQMYRSGPMSFEDVIASTLRGIATVGHAAGIGVHLGTPTGDMIEDSFKKIVGFRNGQPYLKSEYLPIHGGYVDFASYLLNPPKNPSLYKFYIKIYITKITDRNNFDLKVEVKDIRGGLIAIQFMSNKTAMSQSYKLFDQVEYAINDDGMF